MKSEIANIITTMMKLSDEYSDEDIVKGIKSLSQNWPSLTDDEKKEIEACAIAFSVMADVEEEKSKESGYTGYFTESTLTTEKTGFFGRRGK